VNVSSPAVNALNATPIDDDDVRQLEGESQ
jgi:hypothetical protein